nr:multidrug transporter subunit MdtN [uncultured Rhodopila sp.]
MNRGRQVLGRFIALAIIAGAVVASIAAYRQSQSAVSSDDASIDADVVHIAAAVAGRVAEMRVTENDLVRAGDELFHLDPTPYRLAVDQAEADLAIAQGLLEARRRSIAVETSNAAVATQQISHAEENHALASRTVERLRPLAAKSYIPYQQFDQARVAEADTATALAQARQAQIAAQQAIGTLDAETATVRAREAAVAIARRALDQTVVRAPHNGRVTGLSVLSGEIVAPGQSLFTLIATDEWFVSANIREGDLGAIQSGQCVTAYSLIDRRQPIKGVVEGIGWGVLDYERIGLPRALPYVQRSMNWVRVAQRFPVRIRLIDPPEPLMRAGASAVVEIGYGNSCR